MEEDAVVRNWDLPNGMAVMLTMSHYLCWEC